MPNAHTGTGQQPNKQQNTHKHVYMDEEDDQEDPTQDEDPDSDGYTALTAPYLQPAQSSSDIPAANPPARPSLLTTFFMHM